MPVVDMIRPVRTDLEPCGRRADRIISDLRPALRMRRNPRAELQGEHLGAQANSQKRPLLPERDRDPVDLRRMKSSGSFTLIGPPKMTAPAWPSSVSGRGSPKRGRLISNLCPSARSTLPTRPGVDVSWCRTISTGSKESAGGQRARAACGASREVD